AHRSDECDASQSAPQDEPRRSHACLPFSRATRTLPSASPNDDDGARHAPIAQSVDGAVRSDDVRACRRERMVLRSVTMRPMAGDVEAHDSFFSEAMAYERFMGRWSRALARLFVRFANVGNGDGVLDVGAGTGALTAAVAAAAPDSRITG